MQIGIISSYVLIREGITSIISRGNLGEVKFVSEKFEDAINIIENDVVDIIIIDLHANNSDELLLIKEIKDKGIESKVLILDFNKKKDLFVKAIRCGVEGYILAKTNETDIIHIIKQIYEGKKYFDSYYIDYMINEPKAELEDLYQLTSREKEVLIEIGKGLSNRRISEKFFISENTVKKHINHIFYKLNMKDRTQLAIYANKCGIANDNAS